MLLSTDYNLIQLKTAKCIMRLANQTTLAATINGYPHGYSIYSILSTPCPPSHHSISTHLLYINYLHTSQQTLQMYYLALVLYPSLSIPQNSSYFLPCSANRAMLYSTITTCEMEFNLSVCLFVNDLTWCGNKYTFIYLFIYLFYRENPAKKFDQKYHLTSHIP